MRWLIRLIAPAARDGKPLPLIVDPFTGSGTTGLAALVEGVRFAGAELLPKHHEIACARLKSIIDDPRNVEMFDEAPDAEEDQAEAVADPAWPLKVAPDDGTANGMITSSVGDAVYVDPNAEPADPEDFQT